MKCLWCAYHAYCMACMCSMVIDVLKDQEFRITAFFRMPYDI